MEEFKTNELLQDLLSAMKSEEVKALNIVAEEGFEVTNHNQAMFFVKQFKELLEEEAEINRICDTQIRDFTARVEDWRRSQLDRTEKGKAYMEGLLKTFAENELAGSKKRSIKLPFGTIGFTKQQPEYVYDEETVNSFLKHHNMTDFVKEKVVVSIDKKELKSKGVVTDGKLYINNVAVEGIAVTDREDKFSIK